MSIGRRGFVAGAGAGLLWGGWAATGLAADAALKFSDNPFSLGVASGEPEADGVVLWTRLAPKPLEAEGGMPPSAVPVRWEVAEDQGFSRSIASGQAMAEPQWGHSVHVEVRGLKPARVYYYRFTAGGVASPVGRTRTAPALGATPDSFRFCFSSCQKYEAGYYAAYRHMVADNPDLILFVGDYIYEGDPGAGVRKHLNPEPKDLGGYRVRYATYKRDPLLQAAHHAAPWAVIWDDHEVANDYAADLDEYNGDRAVFSLRRAAAYQAYYEHMPLRAASRPTGPAMRIYRTLDWGRLAQFQLIDDRQYRDGHPCQPPELLAEHKKYRNAVLECAERRDPARSILGKPQEQWLLDHLGATRSDWNFLTQQTLMTPFKRIDGAHLDQPPTYFDVDEWEGYPASRERIIDRWRDARTPNPVALGGDIHAFCAAEMVDTKNAKAPVVAAEFVGGSITSHSDTPEVFNKAAAQNPNVRFGEAAVRGYGRATITKARCDMVFRGLANVEDENSSISDVASFVVESGRPGIAKG